MFHMKPSIKRPAILPATRHDGRHAPPSTQENGTGSGATAWGIRHGTIRNAPPAPILTARTTRRDEKRTRKREGTLRERHGGHPKGGNGTPANGENGGGTTRPAARETGRGASRGETEHGTAAESMGTGGNRGAGGEGDGLGRGDYRWKTGGSREGRERRCRFER